MSGKNNCVVEFDNSDRWSGHLASGDYDGDCMPEWMHEEEEINEEEYDKQFISLLAHPKIAKTTKPISKALLTFLKNKLIDKALGN